MALKSYKGSCHCGAIAYAVDMDLAGGTAKCNCSYCSKVRAWKAFVKPAAFHLSAGEVAARTYHKHPMAPVKHFCPTCGITVYETGSADYMGGAFVAVFLATLDDAQAEELLAAPVRYSDGRNDNWSNPPAEVRHL